MKAPLPNNEAARIKALQEFKILDTDPEGGFDDITRLVAHICGPPIAAVSLVDSERLWFKSKVGLDAPEVGRDVAFCSHAILKPELLVVPDALKDIRFADSPLVASGPQLRFYAGTPLTTSDNIAVGALCAIDYIPRDLTLEQKEALEILGRQVVTQIKLRRNLAVIEAALQQRQQSEEALRESKEQYRRLVDLSPETIAVYSKGKFDYINTAGAKLLGGDNPEKLIGKPILDFIHPDYRDLKAGQNQVKGNQVDITQQKFIRLDGKVIDVEVTGIPFTYLGKPATQVVVRDITESKQAKEAMLRAMVAELVKQELEKELIDHKRAEEGLRAQQECIRQIIDINPNMIFVKDAEEKFILVNKAFADFYGTTVESIVGKSDKDFNPNREEIEHSTHKTKEVLETLQKKVSEESFTSPITNKTHWFETMRLPLLSSDNETRQVLGVCTDITEHHQAKSGE